MKRKKAQRHCVLFREFCTDIPPSVQRLSTPLNKVKRPDNFDRSTPDALAQWLDGCLESLTVRNYAAQTVEHRRYTLKLFLAWAILELFYSCGLRRTELCRLELSSFHAERRTLHVRGKGNKDRMVPVGWRAVQWLERYLTEVRPRLCLDTRTQALFLTGYGDAFNPDVLSRMVTAWLERAGLKHKGCCHILRHTCATHMLENGADIRYIQQLLGHEKLDTTAIYTEVSIKQLQEVHARCHPSARQENALISPASAENEASNQAAAPVGSTA